VLSPNLPHTESLKDCMERTIPYFTGTIMPTVAERKTVLVASSENAIRGLLMHLCEIPPSRISEVEIPTGLPLIFDVTQRCLRLLDDGAYAADPEAALARWNFGTATDLLFRPCDARGAGDDCAVDAPDPIIRLRGPPPALRAAAAGGDAPRGVDDLVLGALQGADVDAALAPAPPGAGDG